MNMAFLAVSIRQRTFRSISFPNAWLLNLLVGQRKSTNVDAIDSYISELMENKALKWKVLNKNVNQKIAPEEERVPPIVKRSTLNLTQIFDDLTSNPLVINIESLDTIHIDNLLESAIQEKNVHDIGLLFDQMIEYNRLPSQAVLDQLFRYLVESTDRKRIEQLFELCQRVNPSLSVENNDFLHYKALLQWSMGNTRSSLQNFKDALTKAKSPEMKTRIHRLLQKIVDETIGKKSEAVLLAVIEMSEYCMIELKDGYLLCYVWERSIQSQWFSDQEAAKALFDKHEPLRRAVAERINKICISFLQEARTEQVYQLMELFLKHDMPIQCRFILMRLFDYQFWRHNLRACSEIMQNSIDLNIPLPDQYNQRLLDLLLGRSTLPVRPVLPKALRKQHKLSPKTFELKF